MPRSKIQAKVLAELNRQFNYELSAAQNYHALALWCAEQNFKGFAAFFKQQAKEEQEHADKIAQHMLDRGALPEITAVPAPKQGFKSLLEVAQHAQSTEQGNTQGIMAVYETAVAAKDYPAQFLMQWFISEQVEEEAWTAEMVARVEAAACSGALLDLDRHIVKLLKGEKE